MAKGYIQQEGIDFSETFSPVVKQAIVRVVLSLVAVQKWSIHQMDVKNVFLHGILQETVYISLPP